MIPGLGKLLFGLNFAEEVFDKKVALPLTDAVLAWLAAAAAARAARKQRAVWGDCLELHQQRSWYTREREVRCWEGAAALHRLEFLRDRGRNFT